MKKYITIPAVLLVVFLTAMPSQRCAAQFGIFGSVVSKIVKAMDIAVQKIQTKTLQLQNAQKIVEDEMSKLKLNEITGWAAKEKDLFSGYYGELAQVKAAITSYQKVKDIIRMQVQIVGEYKSAYNLFRQDKHFNPDELNYMYTVYSNLINQSVGNLDELIVITGSFQTKMSDGKRLEMIAAVADKMQKVQTGLLQFNRQNMQVSLNRAQSQADADAVKKYYGLP